MHGLILAGGEGTRLAADGLTTPKALVDVAGAPQMLRIVEQLAMLGCASITCMLQESVFRWLRDAPTPATREAARRLDALAAVVPCRTASSLHTFVAGLEHVPPGPVLTTMVDSVMAPNDWSRFADRATEFLDASADAALALTPPLDRDDAPLWVRVDETSRVTALGVDAASPGALITGGVYVFAPRVRAHAAAVLVSGRHRMRVFLADLVGSGADVRGVELPRIIDIDHRDDLERATAYVTTFNGTRMGGVLP